MKKEETKDKTAMKGGLGTQMFLITYDDLRKFGEECAQNGVEHYLVRSNASKAGTSERLLNTQQVAT